jgi:hypothetical protein
MFPRAFIYRINTAIALVAYAQPVATLAAVKHALQQAEAFPGRTCQAFIVGSIGTKAISVADEPIPVDITFMVVADQNPPLVLRHGPQPRDDIA